MKIRKVSIIFDRESPLKFITYFDDKKAGIYYKFLFESTFDCTVDNVEVFDEVSNLNFDELKYDLVLIQTESNMSTDLLTRFMENKKKLLVCSNNKSIQNILSEDSRLSTNLNNYQAIVRDVAIKMGMEFNLTEYTNQFVKIRIDYLAHIDQALSDIYIKLSEEKYLKIISKGHQITSDELIRIQKKDISHLYVKVSDFEIFIDSMNVLDSDFVTNKNSGELEEQLAISHEILYQINNNFGLNERALKYASKSIELLYTVIEKDENLKKVWESLIKKRNFISEHSLMVGYLANAIISHTTYANESNSIKLSISALLHDLSLKDEKYLPLERGIGDNEDFSKRELDSYRSHITQAVDLLTKIEDMPADVDKIILCHHEKYDGSGYPRGIGWSKIPMLASIFIVAHEVVALTYFSTDMAKDLNAYITEKIEVYKEGYFAEAIDALKRIRA